MLRIYDEHAITARLRIKQGRALAIFAAGLVAGAWLSASGEGVATATAQPREEIQVSVDARSACEPARAGGVTLRLDCRLAPRG